MAHDTPALAGLLATVIVPNWPHLQGTDIDVLDIRDCARRGTPQQRETAKQARALMDKIYALDEQDPVFRLLEAITTDKKSRATGEEIAHRSKEQPIWHVSKLPTEIWQHVLDRFMAQVSQPGNDLQFVALGRLRLVSKAVARYAMSQHPHLVQRYTNRVAARLLHVEGPRTTNFAAIAYSCANLFAPVRALSLYLVGDELDHVNSLLPLFVNLRALTIVLEDGKARICRLRLDGNPRLEELKVLSEPSPWSSEGNDVENERRDVLANRRTLVETEVQAQRGSCSHDADWDRPQSLRRLHAEQGDDHLIACLSGLLCYRGACRLEGVDLLFWKITYDCARTIARWPDLRDLDLRCCSFEDNALDDLGSLQLRQLALDSVILDAAALALATNRSLVRLSLDDAIISGGRFGLNTNHTLRQLDCTQSLSYGGSADAGSFLQDLGAELKQNATLQDLWLDNPAFDDEAWAEFDMAGNTGLRRLSIASSRLITNTGARVRHFKEHTHLRVLYVGGTAVTEQYSRQQSEGSLLRVTHEQRPRWKTWTPYEELRIEELET